MNPPTFWLLTPPQAESSGSLTLSGDREFHASSRGVRVRVNTDIGSDLVDPTHVHHKYAVHYDRDGLVVSFQYYCSLIKYSFRALNGEIRVSSWPFLFALPMDVARTAFDRAYQGRYCVSPTQPEFDEFISDVAHALRLFGSQPLELVIQEEGKKLKPTVFGYLEGHIAAGAPGDLIRRQDQKALEVLIDIERAGAATPPSPGPAASKRL